jgi:hypothetical protein
MVERQEANCLRGTRRARMYVATLAFLTACSTPLLVSYANALSSMDNEAAVTLKCTIASHTGYSGAYRPEHILEDKPGDQVRIGGSTWWR